MDGILIWIGRKWEEFFIWQGYQLLKARDRAGLEGCCLSTGHSWCEPKCLTCRIQQVLEDLERE